MSTLNLSFKVRDRGSQINSKHVWDLTWEWLSPVVLKMEWATWLVWKWPLDDNKQRNGDLSPIAASNWSQPTIKMSLKVYFLQNLCRKIDNLVLAFWYSEQRIQTSDLQNCEWINGCWFFKNVIHRSQHEEAKLGIIWAWRYII